jgi:hypothetical protein
MFLTIIAEYFWCSCVRLSDFSVGCYRAVCSRGPPKSMADYAEQVRRMALQLLFEQTLRAASVKRLNDAA